MSMKKRDWMMTWASLIHAGTFLRQGLESELRKQLGISLAEQDLIKQLHLNAGQLSLSELGKRIYFSKAGITRMLDRLEKAGLVERRAVQGDRRSLTAALTEDGEQLFARSRQVVQRYLRAELKERLSEGDLTDLQRCLQNLLEAHGLWAGQIRHLKGQPGAGS